MFAVMGNAANYVSNYIGPSDVAKKIPGIGTFIELRETYQNMRGTTEKKSRHIKKLKTIKKGLEKQKATNPDQKELIDEKIQGLSHRITGINKEISEDRGLAAIKMTATIAQESLNGIIPFAGTSLSGLLEGVEQFKNSNKEENSESLREATRKGATAIAKDVLLSPLFG